MAPETVPMIDAAVHPVEPAHFAARFPHLAGMSLAVALAPVRGDGGIAVTHDAFDSEVFERPIGRIVDARASSTPGFQRLFDAATTAAEAVGFHQLVRRTAADARTEAWALGASGFNLMDVGLTFARTVDGVGAPPELPGVVVRPATDDDIAALADGMRDVAWGSRYESDPTYSPKQLQELRTRWLWNSHRGRADLVLVGVVDSQPAGFTTCLVDENGGEGEIELVGTLPAFRSRNIASHLVAHAVSFFTGRADLVTVRTQATNFTAARVYERAGFTMHASDFTFRRLLHGGAS